MLPLQEFRDRWRLRVAFGLLLVSGASVGLVCLLSVANWLVPQGEDAFVVYLLAMFSFIPTPLAALGLGIEGYRDPRDREARLGTALAVGHLLFCAGLIALAMWLADSRPVWIVWLAALETAIYGTWATSLAVRWFKEN